MITKEQIIEKLKGVTDPEIGIDVWTLGLIYEIKIGDEGVDITMTLTSPLCPLADEIIADAEKRVGELYDNEGGKVRVELTFDPPWKASDELRVMLGI